MLLEEPAELPRPDDNHRQLVPGNDRRRAGMLLDQAELPEEVARAEDRALAVSGRGHHGSPAHDEVQERRRLALLNQRRARCVRPLHRAVEGRRPVLPEGREDGNAYLG